MGEAGLEMTGAALQPATMGTTVRLHNGQRLVQDGLFAATKEMLGGFIVLDLPDLDTALEWAARSPAATTGAVEVRPVLSM